MSTGLFIVYGLVDPRDGQLRYVGKSCSGKRRARQHANPSRSIRDFTYKGNWVNGLVAAGLRPEVEVLEFVGDAQSLDEAERFWIAYYRGLGCRLTNLTDGGDGTPGHKKTKETIGLMRTSAYRRWGRSEPLDEARLVARYQTGLSLRAVAAEFKTSSSHVFGILKRHGTPIRPKGAGSFKFVPGRGMVAK
jgi:hypothetical protein